jgi:hypothetical protein
MSNKSKNHFNGFLLTTYNLVTGVIIEGIEVEVFAFTFQSALWKSTVSERKDFLEG